MFKFNFNLLKSKTFWAALLGAATRVVMAYLNNEPLAPAISEAIAIVLAAIGLRDALGGPTASSK